MTSSDQEYLQPGITDRLELMYVIHIFTILPYLLLDFLNISRWIHYAHSDKDGVIDNIIGVLTDDSIIDKIIRFL